MFSEPSRKQKKLQSSKNSVKFIITTKNLAKGRVKDTPPPVSEKKRIEHVIANLL